MNHKLILIAVLGISVSVFAGCVAKKNSALNIKEGKKYQWNVDKSESIHGRIHDANITATIKMKLANDDLVSSSSINVDTTNSSVTLNGKVSSQLKIDRALHLGRSVDGVKRVRSNLIVQKR